MTTIELTQEQVKNILAVLNGSAVRGDSIDEFVKLKAVFTKALELEVKAK